MLTNDLIAKIERLRSFLISVSTGGQRIEEVNQEYKDLYKLVNQALKDRQIENPIQYHDLWEWHGRWSSGDLPSWGSRRKFISDLVNPLIEKIDDDVVDLPELTGWERVDRALLQIRENLTSSSTEEQYQGIGLLCREVSISLAQAVYDRNKYPTLDQIDPSETDAKRMFDAIIAVELKGSSAEEARKLVRSTFDFALALQHRRTASNRDALLCVEATFTLVSILAIITGRRDPS